MCILAIVQKLTAQLQRLKLTLRVNFQVLNDKHLFVLLKGVKCLGIVVQTAKDIENIDVLN